MVKRVVLIDDDLATREIFYDILNRMGLSLTTMPSAREGMDMILRDTPDLVLMDVKMPDMDGFEAVRQLRARGAKMRVLMLSVMDDVDYERLALEAGADGFLRKNLGVTAIARAIFSALDQSDQFNNCEKKTLLTVDDDPQICETVQSFFGRRNMQVLTATNGEYALQMVQLMKPDFILLDVNMPGMDGLLLLKKIKSVHPRASVIMVTGVGDEGIAQKAMDLGACEYVTKPISMEYVELCLMKCCILNIWGQ